MLITACFIFTFRNSQQSAEGKLWFFALEYETSFPFWIYIYSASFIEMILHFLDVAKREAYLSQR